MVKLICIFWRNYYSAFAKALQFLFFPSFTWLIDDDPKSDDVGQPKEAPFSQLGVVLSWEWAVNGQRDSRREIEDNASFLCYCPRLLTTNKLLLWHKERKKALSKKTLSGRLFSSRFSQGPEISQFNSDRFFLFQISFSSVQSDFNLQGWWWRSWDEFGSHF